MFALRTFLAGLSGRRVGTDEYGNIYFEGRKGFLAYGRPRRWVLYKGEAEASAVPPAWFGWLHHMMDQPLDTSRPLPWMKPHVANMTGTPHAYRPKGHDLVGGQRARTAGDYEAWTPGS